MTATHWLLLAFAAGLIFIAIWDVRKVAELDAGDHDGLSDEERRAFDIIRERGE